MCIRDRFESALPEQIRDDALLVMDEIAASTGSWRGHISLEAALSFFDDGEVQSAYSDHVDSCAYCQNLLDAMHPTDQAVADFEYAAREARCNRDEAQSRQKIPKRSLVSIPGLIPRTT